MESQNSSTSSSVVAVPGFGYLPKWFHRRLEGIAFDLGIDARVRKKLLEIYWLRRGAYKNIDSVYGSNGNNSNNKLQKLLQQQLAAAAPTMLYQKDHKQKPQVFFTTSRKYDNITISICFYFISYSTLTEWMPTTL